MQTHHSLHQHHPTTLLSPRLPCPIQSLRPHKQGSCSSACRFSSTSSAASRHHIIASSSCIIHHLSAFWHHGIICSPGITAPLFHQGRFLKGAFTPRHRQVFILSGPHNQRARPRQAQHSFWALAIFFQIFLTPIFLKKTLFLNPNFVGHKGFSNSLISFLQGQAIYPTKRGVWQGIGQGVSQFGQPIPRFFYKSPFPGNYKGTGGKPKPPKGHRAL